VEHVNETKEIASRFPLAVFASMNAYELEGEVKRGRMYSWGFLDIENEENNDFIKLRKLLIHCHLDDMIYTTDTIFYNEYRRVQIKNEHQDEILRKSRLLKVKGEMEKILRERNKKKMEKLRHDEERMEMLYKDRMEQLERDRVRLTAENNP
jgi:septin 7